METFKEIDIKYYDNSGNVQVRCTVPVTQDALVHYELMQSHYCKLSFKLSKPIYFLLGDFIDTPYGRFELIDLTKARDNDTIGYSYEIQFDAYYRKLKNKILKYRPNTGSQEATFSLTSKISTHVEVIMKNLSYYAKLDKSYLYDPKFVGEGTDYTYVIDASVDASASKLITYSNASILDAIANIAQTFNCEWWFEGNILHFGTCENTNAIVNFKLDGNIVSMSSSQNQSTYANRVYAFGAARNLPSEYRKDADADITKDGVVEKRLMLPTSAECSDKNKQLLTENGFELKNGYIQVSGLREDQYVEGVTTNDDIYPRNLIKTSNVTSYEKDVEDESTPEEGDFIKRTFYRVGSLTIIGEDGEKTGDMAFRKSYILSGKSLHIVFQSGSLNGMDFECEFNPDGVEEILKDKDGNPILKDGKEQINPKSQVFEIVANEDYGRFLPDITLHPKDGDTFVLYNWDSSKLGNTLVSSASNELLTDAIKNLKKSMIDPTTHTCTADANYSYNQGMGNLHGVGDRVNLYNKGYGDSYRSSRIIGYEFCLDIPYDGAKYYVGEKPSYSRLNAMESKIEELVYNGQSYLNSGGGSGGSSIYIIKSYDKTSPTEYNVYSARAVYKSFLSKLTDDTAEGLITFAKGLVAKGIADLMMGAKFGNSAKITELGEAVFSAIKSLDYDNAAEQGFSVEKEKNGKYHAFFTNLTIWGKAIFHELEIRKRSYSGGNIYLSGAGSKLIKVVPVKKFVSADGVTTWVEMTEDDAESECVGWKCYLLADDGTTATMNYWQEGDQARCQTIGEIAAGGAYSDVSNKSYWRTIPDGGVSTQNEKIYGTKTETYIDEYGNEQTRGVQVELYDGQAFAWIVIGKHGDLDGYDDEFSVGYDGSNPAPLETRDIPSAGDTIVLDGNRHRNEQGEYDKTDRQNVIILETTGEYAPRIACYANITEYKHTITKSVNNIDKEVSLSVFETSPKGGTKINSSRFEWISDDGSTINIINYRGDWKDGTKYHKNDQVNHNNAVWVCVANSGVDVTEEPHDGSSYWNKVISGVKGDKGDKGEDGLSGNGIVPVYTRSDGTPTPPTSTDKNNLDNGWSLAIPSVADVKNVSYSDSSWMDYNDDSGYTWKKSPTTADSSTSSCLVTFTTTQSNQVVKFVIKSFSEPRYDYIFLSEIDAASVPSRPTSNGWYRAVSGNGVESSVIDIIATAGTHTVYVCYGKDNSSSFHGDYGLFRIDSSADIPLWQSNGKEVFTRDDSGGIKSEITSWSETFKVTGEDGADGKDGTDGEQGESALEIIVTPETLVFDTNDYGLVPPETSKQASISCYRNGVKVTNVSYSKSAEKNCSASVSESNSSATVTISRITSQEVADTSGYSSTISNTIGYATIQVWDKDTNLYHRVQVKFMVNVAKFTGQMVNTNKRFSNTLTEVGNKVDKKMDSFNLNEFKSEITQTAREISLSVSEKSIGRRNLLVGSAFNRQEGFGLNLDANVRGYGILMNDGVDGMNCIKVASYYDGTRYQYCGAFWSGNYTKNIRIKHGTQYTFSCWVKVLDANTTVYLEVIYNRDEIGQDIDGRPTGTYSFVISEPNKWQLVKWSFTTDDTHDWIEANVFTSSNVAYKTFVASFCKPMLAEGDYNGWTLSEQDYDYIGGNMLDNTLSLDKSGSLYDVNGTLTPAGFGESTSIYKSFVYKLKGTVDSFSQLPSSGNVYNDTYFVRNEVTCYAYNGSEFVNVGNDYYYEVLSWRKSDEEPFGLEANKDYVFSFMAKGTGRLTAYFYYPDTDVFIEDSLGGSNIAVNGQANFQLTNKWERYWVHWRPSDSLHRYIILRLSRTIQSSAGDAPITNCYIAQPKLEEGARVTEYTERKSDLVDKASLKAAGIEITSDMVELYGNQVKVSGAKGGTPVAMFENGMLNSNLINADKIMARQLQTTGSKGQHISIENGLMRVYGTNGRYNIEFGVNLNGEAVLSYYDKDGKWLYDLGPNKLDGGQLKESTLDGEKYVSALSFFGTNDFFSRETYINVTVKQVYSRYSQKLFGNNSFTNDEQEIENNNAAHMGYKPFERVSSSKVKNLYRYTAPRQSGTIIKDETYGLTTPALAKQADGKYFTSNRDLAINGQLANLAPAGYYFRQSEQVMMAPHPMPKEETQPARFPAYSIRCLKITDDSTGTVMSGFNSMMSFLMITIKMEI